MKNYISPKAELELMHSADVVTLSEGGAYSGFGIGLDENSAWIWQDNSQSL